MSNQETSNQRGQNEGVRRGPYKKQATNETHKRVVKATFKRKD